MKLIIFTLCIFIISAASVRAEGLPIKTNNNGFGEEYFTATEHPGFNDPQNAPKTLTETLADIEPAAQKENDANFKEEKTGDAPLSPAPTTPKVD